MKSLAALFAVIAVTHLSYDPLSMIVGSPQEWFYILRGVEGATVFALLAKAQASILWGLVCLWGAMENSLTAICGVGYMVSATEPGRFAGLCDTQTGLPLYVLSLGIALALAAFIQERANAER